MPDTGLSTQFRFAGLVEPDGRFPIQMELLNLDEIREKCQKIRAKVGLYVPGDDEWDECFNGYHTDECVRNREWIQTCIQVAAEEAKQCLERLPSVPLLTACGQDPWKANGLRTLEGMAQGSCIYGTR